jgi:hypothetical protein
MKQGLFLAVLILFILSFSICNGQDSLSVSYLNDSTAPKPLFGLKLGMNVETITSSDWVKANNLGVTGGFFAGFHKNKFGVRAEILVSTTSYKSTIKIDSGGNVGDFNVVYFNVPLLFEYNITSWLSIQVGPQYNNLVSITKNAAFNSDPKVLFTPGGFSGAIGLEGKLPHNVIAGARYIYGFSNLNNYKAISTVNNVLSSQDWHTRSLQIYLGYSIR